jgi:DNA/RNA-binding domain of Phe-tRNA-synthetase-like protein
VDKVITFRATDDIFKSFPEVLLGIVVARDIENHGEHADVMAALRKEENRIREEFTGVQITDHPNIAPWREAYRKFGAKPKENPSSIENLVRRVVKGHTITHINTIVDLYNTISLRYVVPVGGEDLDRIYGDVILTFAGSDEAPVLLLGEKEERPPKPGEVIYKDERGAICRRWNWKEAERTKLTEETRNAFLITEALPPLDHRFVESVVQELAGFLRQYCSATVTHHLLNSTSPDLILLAD